VRNVAVVREMLAQLPRFCYALNNSGEKTAQNRWAVGFSRFFALSSFLTSFRRQKNKQHAAI
jgi:hypothetical protein